jgi:hypothetical protein
MPRAVKSRAVSVKRTSAPEAGGQAADRRRARTDLSTSSTRAPRRKPRPRRLEIGVVWSDFTDVAADVLIAGHYIGVLPQRAEHQLDCLASGHDGTSGKLVVTELTRRGVLRGALGEVVLFPGPGNKLIAIAGLGRPGTFGRNQARVLACNIAQVIGLLPRHDDIATVLIGSGEGNLTVPDATNALLEGVIDALDADPQLMIRSIVIVEKRLDRALDIQEAVTQAVARLAERPHAGVTLSMRRQLPRGSGRDIPAPFGCSMILAALARGTGKRGIIDTRRIIDVALADVPEETRERVRQHLKDAIGGGKRTRMRSLRAIARKFRLHDALDMRPHIEIPVRLAFWCAADAVHGAAITNSSTVTERAISRRVPLVLGASEKLQRPQDERWQKHASSLHRLLVPTELQPVWEGSDALVVEVDATLAGVQWEMLPASNGAPQGVCRSMARQLRTLYSPRPVDVGPVSTAMKALVIGDPGDAEAEMKIARDEAQAVAKLLSDCNIQTTVRIGAPADGTDAGPIPGIEPADYFEVVDLLLGGEFDIVHYCGHAVFDPDSAARTGWLFKKRNLLTAAELVGMKRPPRLVFANACLTAQLAQPGAHAHTSGSGTAARGDPRLVASLADEFFKQGVFDYIGTAWEVESAPALLFAKEFYGKLLDHRTHAASSIGDAILAARVKLYKGRQKLGMGWAAYQHYGDPTRFVRK